MSKLDFFPSIIDADNRDKLGLELSIDENCIRATSLENGDTKHYSLGGIEYGGIKDANTVWRCKDGFVGPIRDILGEILDGKFHGLYLENKDNFHTDYRDFFLRNKKGRNSRYHGKKGGQIK